MSIVKNILCILTLTSILMYYIYIFYRFKNLRLKKWFFAESILSKYKIRITVKFFLKKFLFIWVKNEKNNARYLKYCYYRRLRWKSKPQISSVVFHNKNIKTIIITVSFR